MKRLVALMMCAVSFGATAQSTITYPYNPDGDVDGSVASPDLLDFLGVYGGEFVPNEIQIDGVGLLQVIQNIQSQLLAIQPVDINQIQSLLEAMQQEIDALNAANSSLTQQLLDHQAWVEEQGFLTEESDPVAMLAMPTRLTDLTNWVDDDNDGWNDHQYATVQDVLNIARDYQYSNYFEPDNRTWTWQDFNATNWTGAQLQGWTFDHCFLQETDFLYANMQGVTFVNTNLYHVDFTGADLSNSTWIGTLPSYGNSYNDNCWEAFDNTNLTGADFSQNTVRPGFYTFNGANMSGAIIPDFWEGGFYGFPDVMPDGWTIAYVDHDDYVTCTTELCLSSPCGVSWGGSTWHSTYWKKN